MISKIFTEFALEWGSQREQKRNGEVFSKEVISKEVSELYQVQQQLKESFSTELYYDKVSVNVNFAVKKYINISKNIKTYCLNT